MGLYCILMGYKLASQSLSCRFDLRLGQIGLLQLEEEKPPRTLLESWRVLVASREVQERKEGGRKIESKGGEERKWIGF